MMRIVIFFNLLFFSVLCFAQQNSNFKVIGIIPNSYDTGTYQIQVGAFENLQNAQRVFERLVGASFAPVYERHLDLTRVVINGIAAEDVQFFLQRIRNAGFVEVIIRIDTGYQPIEQERVCTARPPEPEPEPEPELEILPPPPPPPPSEDYSVVPDSQVIFLPPDSKIGERVVNITEYRTVPAFRLAYRYNNSGESNGASGGNGGIDVIAGDVNNRWLFTTYYQGGWFYDLNGVRSEMVNGFQKDANNGVELTIRPEFVYDKGVPYLQITHSLRNPNNFGVTGQKFGASSDVMINQNDHASILHTPYGAFITDSADSPSFGLRFVCETGNRISPVDTLWFGAYNDGEHLNYIYVNRRNDFHGEDSAIGFSYQNIDLAASQTKSFVVRFTLAGNE